MKIPRISLASLVVADLRKATKLYETVLGTPPNTSYGSIDYLGRDTYSLSNHRGKQILFET